MATTLEIIRGLAQAAADRLDANFKSFLEQGGFGKRPENDTRKKEKAK